MGTKGVKVEQTVEERLQQALDRATGRAEMADVYFVSRTGTPVEFENNRLKSINTAEHAGAAVRVVVGGRVGLSTTTKLESLDETVDNAIATAAFGGPAEFDMPGPDELPADPETFDATVTEFPVERMVDLGERALAPIRELMPEIQAFAGLDCEQGRILLINSNGYRGEYRSTGFGFWVGGELVEGENMLWAYDGFTRGNLGDVEGDAARYTKRVVDLFRLGRENVPMRAGRYPVLFSPRAMSDLLRPLVARLDGKAVEKGISPWKEKLGRQVSGPKVTIIDDGTLPFGPHTAPFDGEGTACRLTPMVTEGRLEAYYLDRRTARKLGLTPTGNGLRGLGSLPSPSPTNLILEGGNREHRELLAGIREGVWIESVMGAWAGNPYTGEVQGNISLGFLVRNGEPVGRIKNCLFAANAFDAFRDRLAELSSDQDWSGSQLLPYALFEDIAISTKG